MVFRFTIRILLLFIFSQSIYAQNNATIRIISTTDVHGALFPFDFIDNRAADYGLAHVLTYVDELREDSTQEIILLDNGDILQGQPTVYYGNYIDTTSSNHIVSKVMNYMQYNAGTIGNHDIEAGPTIYNRLKDEFKFPWLSANIIDKRTGLPYFKPYTVFERNGIRIAILGLTTPGVTKWLPSSLWENMEFNDMVESSKIWMDSIRTKENPHIIIGLFHAGHDATYELSLIHI